MPKQSKDFNATITDVYSRLGDLQVELVKNTEKTGAIVDRLDKLNGSVGKHDTQIALLTQTQALQTQTTQTLNDAANKANKERAGWVDWLLKGAAAIGIVIVYNILIKTGLLTALIQ